MPTSSSPDGLRPGDPVLVRSVFRGRVRSTFPHRFVGVDDGRIVLYRGPGAQGKTVWRDADGRYLARWVGDVPPRDALWSKGPVLQLVRPGDAHAFELLWDEAWGFAGWYVNLQAPLRRTPLGFDTEDWALDVIVEPDGSWRWKDEDDLAEAIALGVLDEAAAAAVRAEGERVVAAQPWPTGWEDWRPPAEWAPLPLAEGWDDV